MLKFFRRIRRSLIDEGNLKRYLIYAIGEILLVVIGILIALQINNWNIATKEERVALEYLKRFHLDLQKDTTFLGQKIQTAKTEQESYYFYIQSMYEVQSTKDDYVQLTSSVAWNSDDLILQDKTYSEITSSGNLDLISDVQLKEAIMDYYKDYSLASNHISEMNQTSIEMLMDFTPKLTKYYESLSYIFDKEKMFSKEDWIFINNPHSIEFNKLEGIAGFYSFKHSVFEKYYANLLANAAKLLEQIDHELDK